ncbi:MAG: ABC transporter substrate-binding protein, partial [Deltaproteobacteria bacterium]|nr:ABC transporter substrate-binding protein [Deltaproteobacteria bacterium]
MNSNSIKTLGGWLIILTVAVVFNTSPALAQKSGGILMATQRENPPSLAIPQESTISTVWPMMPVYNNLVMYDWKKAVEGPDTIVPELAESWSWDKSKTKLTFKLRKGVTWHDGKPFTSADVKHTFDVLNEVGTVTMKVNPRKAYYSNVKEITTKGDYEVTFVMNRPQPGFLSILATGYSPVMPAHIAPDELRTTAVGTGPFKLKNYAPDQSIELEKNPSYWRKGRPYLDGINFVIIKSRPSRTAALQAGQVDIAFPTETGQAAYETLKSAVKTMVFQKVAQAVGDNILMNIKKPPFDNIKVRQAVTMAMDRTTMISSVHQGLAVPGGAN